MTTFDIIRNIFAVIGLIGVISLIGGLVFICAFGVQELMPDEHSDVTKARG